MGSGATGKEASPELLAIGQRLRAARELRRLTLDSVEEATHIRRTYLLAIEEGRAEDVPGEVFLKGFIRTYANHLGLDGAEIVEGYKQALRGSHVDAGGEASAGAHRRRRLDPAAQERPARLRGGRARPRRRRGARTLWWLAGIAAVAVAGWAVAAGGHPGTRPASASASSASAPQSASSASTPSKGGTAAPSQAAVPPSSVAPVPAAPTVRVGFGHTNAGWQGTYSVAGATSLRVEISTRVACWTRRWVDGGGTYTDQTLAQNGPDTVTWSAAKSLKVWVGNAPGIAAILVDGQPTPALPPQGSDDSEWLTFTLVPAVPGG